MSKFQKIVRVFKDSSQLLSKNQPLVLASSTAFFTIFAIPTMLIIVLNIFSLYFKSENLSETFYGQLQETFSKEVADQIAIISENFAGMASEPWITVAGSVFLVFVATNLFKVIKISINQLWSIKPYRSKNVLINLKSRAIALGIIIITGTIFLLFTVADSLVAVIERNISDTFFGMDTYIILAISKVVSIVFIAAWFVVVFRFLPDGKVSWKGVLPGAIVTAVLFLIGKYLLERFLINSNINSIFETSTSVVLIMLFIFYVSLIMYYGASFTYIYSASINRKIKPRSRAERYKITIVDE